MSRNGSSARAILDAWQEQRADRLDPIRFHFIDALESRANRHGGEVRRILDERLSRLLEAYAGDLERARSEGGDPGSAEQPRKTAGGALGGLLQHIADRTPAMGDAAAVDAAAPRPSSFPELPALDEFRGIWAKVHSEGQLRQSLQQVPANAGPLNSGVLVHRSITLMREVSPGYLQHFLSYVDALSWLQQMHGDGVLATRDTPRTAAGKQHTRNKPRRRRD